VADWWRRRTVYGRLYTGLVSALLPFPLLLAMMATNDKWLAYALNLPLTMTASMWIGAGISSVHDLVPARLRGTAGAVYLLVLTFIGLALGPYGVGKLSVILGGLKPAMLTGAVVGGGFGLVFLLLALRTLPADLRRFGETG
jgi:hypothetical protein